MKKVLILTAEKTGTGHKSSANAIEFALKEKGIEAEQLNCFTLMGKLGRKMEESYIPLTTKHPFIWKIAHKFSEIFTNTLHRFMYHRCKKEMLKKIKEFQPDLIISVHGMFTKAVSHLLKVNHLDIPFMINVIDLVNPPRVWRDKRAQTLFLPTQEVYKQYIKLGFKESQLVVSGFPIRTDILPLNIPKQIGDTIKILMVNPSINLKKNLKLVKEVSQIKNAEISVVCGRDSCMFDAVNKLKQQDESLKDVAVYGFVNNMNELLNSAHLILTKAGPNMLLEATRSGTAVIVTDHIPGQEACNYEYITKNGYGIKCENPKKIKSEIINMMQNGDLTKFLKNTLHSDCNDGAKIISENIAKKLNSKNV